MKNKRKEESGDILVYRFIGIQNIIRARDQSEQRQIDIFFFDIRYDIGSRIFFIFLLLLLF